MERTEELQCEIDALTSRIAACEEATRVICDGLASYLEVTGVISRAQLGEMMLMAVQSRRIRGEGSSVELDQIENAARWLFLPSQAIVTAAGGVVH